MFTNYYMHSYIVPDKESVFYKDHLTTGHHSVSYQHTEMILIIYIQLGIDSTGFIKEQSDPESC